MVANIGMDEFSSLHCSLPNSAQAMKRLGFYRIQPNSIYR